MGISNREIELAVFQMGPYKAPGPDGILVFFYQHFWDTVKVDVCNAVQAFFHSSSLLKALNQTFITLIPKIPHPEEVSHFWPISLCNVIYKVISKVLVSRLKPIMDSIITPYQNAFIKGRNISDNILLAHEILDVIRKKRGRRDKFGVLKIDMSKAYDRVNWNILKAVLTIMKFDSKWINWIMECVSSVEYTLLINGSMTRNDNATVHNLQLILNWYCSISGQSINLAKSDVFCFPNMPMEEQRDLARTLQVTLVQQPIPEYVCNKMDSIIRAFWWGHDYGENKLHMINWDRVSQPKKLGGLGIRKFGYRDTNSNLGISGGREDRGFRLVRQSAVREWQLILKLVDSRRRVPHRYGAAYEAVIVQGGKVFSGVISSNARSSTRALLEAMLEAVLTAKEQGF
nr:uncharacterized protein LOC112031661 [Quercus suber]